MATATVPPTDVTNAELIRWAFDQLNRHDVEPLAIDGIDHFVFGPEGRLLSNFVVVDQLQYARQVGMMPPDGSAADRAFKRAFNLRTRLAAKLTNRQRA